MVGLMSVLALIVLLMAPADVGAADPPPRVGFAEEFDTFEGWEPRRNWPHGEPFERVEVKDGVTTLTTHCGALNHRMLREDWPEWPKKPYPGFVTVTKTYEGEVDFDRYHYLVVRMPKKGTFVQLGVSGVWTKVCYTAGLHAQDLKPLGLTGRKQMRLSLTFLNTSGLVAFDYIRLASELTPEERAALIPEGLDLPKEGLTGHPYHRLEALNRRADGPTREGLNEWVVFRDVSTGAVLWKMTAMPSDEHGTTFNGDGSAFLVRGRHPQGLDIFRFATREYVHWEEGLTNPAPRFSSTEPSKLLYFENEWLRAKSRGHRKHSAILRDIVTGEREEIASFETEASWVVNEFSAPADTPKMLFGHRETPLTFLIDPTVDDPDRRVTRIELPTRLKGVNLLREGTLIRWHNCYTYQSWQMDLATGQVRLAHSPQAGGHSAGGENFIVGPYGAQMKIVFPRDLEPVDESTADQIRVFGNYRKPLQTDYGGLTDDEKWVRTNGVRGDVAGQHLLISTEDPGTVLHVVFYNTSRNDWVTNTYSAASPDHTKLAYVSDMLGNGDVYFALTRLPDPPRQLTVTRTAGGNLLRWGPPGRGKEIATYAIYRSRSSGQAYDLVTTTDQTTFTDSAGTADSFYLVAAREHSRLEGHFSQEASAEAGGTRRLHFEGESGTLEIPMRQVFDGHCSGYRYVRVTPETEEESVGSVRWQLPEGLGGGPWWLWGRVRARRAAGAFTVQAGEAKAGLPVEGDEWHWKRSGPVSALRGADTLALTADATGLSLDKAILTDDPEYVPVGLDDRKATPPPQPSGLRVARATPTRIDLTWDASESADVAYYSVYVGEFEEFEPGNETVLCAIEEVGDPTIEPRASDVGLKPRATQHYKVIAHDWRGNASPAASLTAQTAAAEPVLVVLEAEQAQLEAGLAVTEVEGATAVLLPVEAAEAEPETVRWATFTFSVPAGEYLLWARYAPGNTSQLSVECRLDDAPLGRWRMRAPYRPLSRALTTGSAERLWFADKVRWGHRADVLKLSAGEHRLKVAFDPSLGEQGHWLDTFYLTNDFSFRPDGWDPRIDFHKTKRR